MITRNTGRNETHDHKETKYLQADGIMSQKFANTCKGSNAILTPGANSMQVTRKAASDCEGLNARGARNQERQQTMSEG